MRRGESGEYRPNRKWDHPVKLPVLLEYRSVHRAINKNIVHEVTIFILLISYFLDSFLFVSMFAHTREWF